MAAYAAVVSLMNTIDNIQNHPRLSTSLDKNQIQILAEKLDFLLDFIESYNSNGGSREIEDLESKIASAANAAEDQIESYIVDQILSGSTKESSISFPDATEFGVADRISARSTPNDGETSSSGFLRSLQKQIKSMKKKVMNVEGKKRSEVDKSGLDKVILAKSAAKNSSFQLGLQEIMEELDSIMEKLREVKQERGLKGQQLKYPMPVAPSRPLKTGKTTVVGSDTNFNQLLDWLTGEQSCRQIISITGMGGIGKTTLARNVYENRFIVQHFDIRAWVVASPEYNVCEILDQILSCLGESTSELDKRTEDELGRRLHKILFGRRYLIILDDMWSIEAWNKISLFFPENDNRSRIVVTTRLLYIANHFGSLVLEVNFLSDDESWSLFCENAFAPEHCPPDLERVAKKIVKKCKGLPLSIVVIGGLLGKSSRAHEYWEIVASDISSFQNSESSNQCLDVLSLSYNHLPARLKPCFLHLGTFPEDHEIRVSLLVKLWVAEGFLKPNEDQSLEEVAEHCIMDLVGRNLVSVSTTKLNGKIKTCTIHDLLRDLCLRIAEKDKFFCVTRSLDSPGDEQRRIILRGSNEDEYHTPIFHHTLEPTSITRSLICHWRATLSLKSRLLRVLIGVDIDSMNATFELVNLRFLAYQYENSPTYFHKQIPSSISLLWNVQTLIIMKGTSEVEAPIEIWEMRQLRHLRFSCIYLPYPPLSDNEDDIVILNLQTIETASNFSCSEDVCKRMPNIKKLRLMYGGWRYKSYELHNVGRLSKLESLKCSFIYPTRDNFLQSLSFPTSLKKLTLENGGLRWSDMTVVGTLRHLEVLKLRNVVDTGPEWNPVDGEFLSLKFLGIYGCSDLTCWNADNSHFPVLEKLVFDGMWRLGEILSGIGDIPTLERICVYDCSISAAISAVKILEEQEKMGNLDLQVEVEFSAKKKLGEFRKEVELEGLTTHNLQIDSVW